MAKSIQERVRATLEKAAREEQRAADKKRATVSSAAERKAIREEQRIEGLMDGSIEPRTLAEFRIADGFLDDDLITGAWSDDVYSDDAS